jgi:hypothetical protein
MFHFHMINFNPPELRINVSFINHPSLLYTIAQQIARLFLKANAQLYCDKKTEVQIRGQGERFRARSSPQTSWQVSAANIRL